MTYLPPALQLHKDLNSSILSTLIINSRMDYLLNVSQEIHKFRPAYDYKSLVVTPLHFKKTLPPGVNFLAGHPKHMFHLSVDTDQLNNVKLVIIDDIDFMMESNFESELRSLLNKLSSNQLIIFSSTWNNMVQQLLTDYLKNPIRLHHIPKTTFPFDPSISHSFISSLETTRNNTLLSLLKSKNNSGRIILFCESLYAIKLLQIILKKENINHSFFSCSSFTRVINIDLFEKIILVTDSLVNRLEIGSLNVQQVIHFQAPKRLDQYFKRVATLQSGNKIESTILITPSDHQFAKEFNVWLRTNSQPSPPELIGLITSSEQK